MLKVYRELFAELNNNNIEYIVYKGLSHIEQDLKGENGDIDILLFDIKKYNQIMKNEKWIKILKNNYPYYYFKLYDNKNLMLDVENKISYGKKPFKPLYFNIKYSELKLDKYYDINILNSKDYIPLMFIMRVTSLNPKNVNLTELKELISKTKIDGYMKDKSEQLTAKNWEEIEKDIVQAKNWEDLKIKYEKIILKNSEVNYTLLTKQKLNFFIKKINIVKRKIFKVPSYRVRKEGYLVAFMGNDGAGKSSTIDFIKEIDYFKYTGIKMIYFGNNQYVLPFLNYFMQKTYTNKVIRLLLGTLGSVDKKCRALIAKYYINLGYIVLADRYVYDELMGIKYSEHKKTNNLLKKLYRYLTAPKMLIKPEVTFFLDVNPEIAYQRKQDYDFSLVIQNIERYREFLSQFDEVVRIDANQSQKDVIKDVVEIIYEKDIEINKKY